MTVQISIRPSDHTFGCEPDETVLQAAMRADLMIPYGCRNGACGTCKGRILDGSVDFGAHQPSTLTDDEKRRGIALFCVARPRSDLVIEVREVRRAGDIQIKRLPCRIESIDKPVPDVAIVKLKLPSSERLQYLAGQYIDFLLKDGKRRSFSLATRPDVAGVTALEIHVRHTPGGVFTDHVFEKLKVRDLLRFEGPLGSFYLREDSDRPIVMVASGTGFAPIKAIALQALEKKVSRPITLYWGARLKRDLYMLELAQSWKHLKFIPVLSDEKWDGRMGFVHRAVMEDFPDMSGVQVYACGAPIVVESARKDFSLTCKLPAEEFYADSFLTEADKAAA